MQVHKVNHSNRVGKEPRGRTFLMWKTMVFAVIKHHGAEEIVDDANFFKDV